MFSFDKRKQEEERLTPLNSAIQNGHIEDIKIILSEPCVYINKLEI